jgi:hypothetical protein
VLVSAVPKKPRTIVATAMAMATARRIKLMIVETLLVEVFMIFLTLMWSSF